MTRSGLALTMIGSSLLVGSLGHADQPPSITHKAIETPIQVGEFLAEVRDTYTVETGLPHNHVRCVATTGKGVVYAGTAKGLVELKEEMLRVIVKDIDVTAIDASDSEIWFTSVDGIYRLTATGTKLIARLPSSPGRPISVHDIAISSGTVWLATSDGLWRRKDDKIAAIPSVNLPLGGDRDVRQVAVSRDGQVAIAAAGGAWIETTRGGWQPLFPYDQIRSWAPRDVRGVSFDSRGHLWIASPQGVAVREDDDHWNLFSGEDGLPYNDFSGVVAGRDDHMWFGTKRGAIRFDGLKWRYRMAPRWLPADEVLGVAIDDKNQAWFATPNGLGVIRWVPQTLSQKAERFEQQIDRYHRRTEYGYVDGVSLDRPGDLAKWTQHDSDNDGLWTSMYGAGECLAYAATGSEISRRRAWAAFEAVQFLSEVTQGGSPPARPGFPARSILPTSGPDPNLTHTAEHDRRQRLSEPLWKVISPRWPTSADGKWYWKCDTSSDELDGHFFLYARCFDLVAQTDEERRKVSQVVSAIVDHLIDNQFELIDHDGQPTRWARYGPHVLNGGVMTDERGLNSLSILSYLKVARHVTGDDKYQRAYDELVQKHSYAANILHPKFHLGPGTGNQSDDEMAFMSFYNLLTYETDDALRAMYLWALREYWSRERPEGCPLFDFIWAVFDPNLDHNAKRQQLLAGVETLKRFPTDLVHWPYDHSHRLDLVRLPFSDHRSSEGGHLRGGYVIPIDERSVAHWNHDPWAIAAGNDGRTLADGASFLLPYYLGLCHGILE